MPTPFGHALGGALLFSLAAPRGRPRAGRPALADARLAMMVMGAMAGMAPDLDLLVGLHSRQAHSMGFAALAGTVAACVVSRHRSRFGVAVALGYASHLLLDWLGSDTSPPIGIMALWPITSNFYQSAWHLFPAVPRRPSQPEFWTALATALLWESLLLAPPTFLAVRCWRRRQNAVE